MFMDLMSYLVLYIETSSYKNKLYYLQKYIISNFLWNPKNKYWDNFKNKQRSKKASIIEWLTYCNLNPQNYLVNSTWLTYSQNWPKLLSYELRPVFKCYETFFDQKSWRPNLPQKIWKPLQVLEIVYLILMKWLICNDLRTSI